MADSSKNQDPQKQRKLLGLLSQLKARRESGQSVDPEAMLRAFPELATELKAYFKALEEGRSTDDAFASTRLGNPDVASSHETFGGSNRQSDTSSEFAARMFGRYRLLRPLGEGAMGSVFLALDTTLDRQVALKMPKPSATDAAEFLTRFTREARAAAGLKHPSICSVYDAGEVDGTAFITMDFIDGVPLSKLIGTPSLQPVSEVLRIAKIIASAIEHAHQNGVIHRDLKSGNILIDASRNPVVTDFGLARRLVPTEGTRVTQEGLLIGTPAYMAPEQVRGEQDKVGIASDIYSFGVVLFEMLVGRLPFDGRLPDLLAKVLRDLPPIPSRLRSDLTEDVDDVVLKMLQKDPSHRYRSMAEVMTAIERLEGLWSRTQARVADPSIVASMSSKVTDTLAASTFDVLKSHIEAALKKGQYATAIQDLEKLASETAPLAKNAAAWAKKKLPAVRAEAKAMSPAALAGLLKTAQELYSRHDYAGCIQLLNDVPTLRRSSGMEDLLAKAHDRETEAEMLLEDIRDRERREMIDGLEPLVRKLLKLKPGNAYAKKLMQALQTYSKTPVRRRNYRFERGRLQPMPEISFFRQWAVLCVLTFVLVFVGVYTYVVKVLNSNEHVILVEIDREWLREQGGELTISIDDVDHPAKLPASDNSSFDSITTIRGEHLIGVKKGESFVYGPREFVIEQKDPSTLKVTSTEMKLIGGRPAAAGLTQMPGEANDERLSGQSDNENASPANADGWVTLFDGTKATGWASLGPFQVRDGLLVGYFGRGMAVSELEYGDFELEAEWRLTSGGDGGIYYREVTDLKGPGNEYQIIDPSFPGIKSAIQKTGAFYGVIPPAEDAEKPLGDWNRTRIRCEGDTVEHWLNDRMVAKFTVPSDEWSQRLTESNIRDDKTRLGVSRKGHVMLNSQLEELAFRSIRIRSKDGSVDSFAESTTRTAIDIPKAIQTFESEKFRIVRNASPEEILAWTQSLPKEHCPIWMSLRADSHEPRFECITAKVPSIEDWAAAIVEVEGETFEQPPLKGKTPIALVSFREGAQRRSLGVAIQHSERGEFWFGYEGFIQEKVAAGLKKQTQIRGENFPHIPVYLAANQNSPGMYYMLLQPRDPFRNAEVKTQLTKEELIRVLNDARARNHRANRIGFDRILNAQPTFFTVITENVAIESRNITEKWSYAMDVSDEDLQRQLIRLSSENSAPRSLFSYIWDNKLNYCVIWDNVTPEELNMVSTASSRNDSGQNSDSRLPQVEATMAVAPFDAVAAGQYQQAWAKKISQRLKLTDDAGIDLVLLPPGEFTMGSPDKESDRSPVEGPQHTVRISQPFYMGATEISQEQWFKVMGTRPWARQPYVAEGNDYPACFVNWFEAKEFCQRLSNTSEYQYRLPTEAEWEYAGRAGTTKPFYFFDANEGLSAHAWFTTNTIKKGQHHAYPVGTLKPNPFGLFDMHGNLWEWCEDQFVEDCYSKRSGITVDPLVTSGDPGIQRITRGGGFDAAVQYLRIANRGLAHPGFKSHRDGFRVVRVVEKTQRTQAGSSPDNRSSATAN